MQIGYCTNVHAGADLDQVLANLKRFAVPVRQRFCPTEQLGIGLWLSASAASKVIADHRLPELAGWLKQNGLLPFTLNGFPYGDFHLDVVKHQVYLPTWHESARSEYTRNLIAILHGLLPPGLEGSISTMPLSWGAPEATAEQLYCAAAALANLAGHLARIEQETGRLIHLDLEPEPGCVLQRSGDVVRFFENYLLLPGRDEGVLRRHLRICHDICHAAVMFEEQSDVLERYGRAGIAVGKIQVSSAVSLDLHQADAEERANALRQLAGFNEPRYLHQTVVRLADGPPVFFEDLHLALASPLAKSALSWRVHFHVPIYVDRFGHLSATQRAIRECLSYARAHDTTHHFEAETYAWGVLPAELRQPDLAAGIAEEMAWLKETKLTIDN
jgi:hypothetical protein